MSFRLIQIAAIPFLALIVTVVLVGVSFALVRGLLSWLRPPSCEGGSAHDHR